MSEALPVPRHDPTEARKDLDSFGYCLVEDGLTTAELDRLGQSLDAVAEQERDDGTAWFSNGNQRVFALTGKGPEFLSLVEHPLALEMATHLLGAERLLSSITANIALPGNQPQALHTDQQYVKEPWAWPATINVVWLLDDFTEENGGTRIVPGTHQIGVAPFSDAVPTVSATAPAGSVLCIDGRVWHGTGRNITASCRRRAIFAYYCVPFLRQQENVFQSLPAATREGLSPTLRQLLGYDVWQGLGVVAGLPLKWMGTGRRSGPVNADPISDSPYRSQ